jgi:alpha-amylase
MHLARVSVLGFAFVALALTHQSLFAQGGYQDDRVLIQGFIWESHQSGENTAKGGHKYQVDWREKWYQHVRSKTHELAAAEFDLVWLPPPSQGEGAGYHPQELFNLDNNYGTEGEHRELLRTLLSNGLEPIADVVINHRSGTGGWATFKNPDWPSEFICANDEFWFKQPHQVAPSDVPILQSGRKGAPDYGNSNWPNWDGSRDLDHTTDNVRSAIKDYLRRLKQYGYRGWRYDMVKGYDPTYIAEYNFDSQPTFAVGEYLDNNTNTLTWWIDGTRMWGQPDPAQKACSALDFSTQELLKHLINAGQYNRLPAVHFKDGVDDGLIALNKNKAVTFLESHDSGFPQQQFDSFTRNEKLLQGYAYILTHPGVPCVYWKHYFGWGFGNEIKALVRARKYAGVTSGSFIKSEVHGNDYVAVVGDRPDPSETLIVKIGHGTTFNPGGDIWGLETSGNGYAVWVRKAKKTETQQRVDGPKQPFPVP